MSLGWSLLQKLDGSGSKQRRLSSDPAPGTRGRGMGGIPLLITLRVSSLNPMSTSDTPNLRGNFWKKRKEKKNYKLLKLSFFFPSENVAPSWIYDSAALPVASVPVLPPGRRKCRCSPPDLKTLPYILRVRPFLYQFLYFRFLYGISLHSMIGQGSAAGLHIGSIFLSWPLEISATCNSCLSPCWAQCAHAIWCPGQACDDELQEN